MVKSSVSTENPNFQRIKKLYTSVIMDGIKIDFKIDLMNIAKLDFNEFENVIADNPKLITLKDANDRLLIHW